jgi:hypothetical protein
LDRSKRLTGEFLARAGQGSMLLRNMAKDDRGPGR